MNRNLLGVVVCGGQSKRMGSDKGLLPVNNKTWAEHLVEKLERTGIEVIVSINVHQQQEYKKLFAEKNLVVDGFDIGGPMNGLLSVHGKLSEMDILLIACDMIEMEESLLKNLIAAYEDEKSFDFYAYEIEGVMQPFCAIYRAGALKRLLQRLEQQTLGSSSLRYTLEQGNTQKLTSSCSLSFINYNTLGDRRK